MTPDRTTKLRGVEEIRPATCPHETLILETMLTIDSNYILRLPLSQPLDHRPTPAAVMHAPTFGVCTSIKLSLSLEEGEGRVCVQEIFPHLGLFGVLHGLLVALDLLQDLRSGHGQLGLLPYQRFRCCKHLVTQSWSPGGSKVAKLQSHPKYKQHNISAMVANFGACSDSNQPQKWLKKLSCDGSFSCPLSEPRGVDELEQRCTASPGTPLYSRNFIGRWQIAEHDCPCSTQAPVNLTLVSKRGVGGGGTFRMLAPGVPCLLPFV